MQALQNSDSTAKRLGTHDEKLIQIWLRRSRQSIVAVVPACRQDAAEFMFRARVDGQMLEGKPLSWSTQQMLLLGRDGQLHEFNPKLAKEARKPARGSSATRRPK